MGCDIHLHVEGRLYGGDDWFHLAAPYSPREYQLFGHLAQVRCKPEISLPPRGFPDDASWETKMDYGLYVEDDVEDYSKDEDGQTLISRATANEYLEKGYVQKLDNDLVSGPDWHSASHLNYWLFEMQLSRAEKDASAVFLEYRAIANYMHTFESVGKETRVVFWFDN